MQMSSNAKVIKYPIGVLQLNGILEVGKFHEKLQFDEFALNLLTLLEMPSNKFRPNHERNNELKSSTERVTQ